MTGTDDTDDDGILAAEYALGLLDRPEAEAFEARMAAEPALRALYAEWEERFAALTDELPEVAPPGSTYDDIEDRLFPLQKRRAGGMGWLRGLVGAGVLVAALAVAVLFFAPGEPAVVADFRADLTHPAFDTIGVGATDDGVFHLILFDYVEPPEGSDYELWLVAGDEPPVSLGLVPRGETGDYWTELPPEITAAFAGGAVAVSVEPAGGSPTGAPSDQILDAVGFTDLR
ncbi:hypothetical protein HKCCE2091_09785 [Rhodobacterales bacterium HKCCE2091]|nr:hypothetical protein [Rhodobacterales bacterium HKCCE2091]